MSVQAPLPTSRELSLGPPNFLLPFRLPGPTCMTQQTKLPTSILLSGLGLVTQSLFESPVDDDQTSSTQTISSLDELTKTCAKR